MQQRVKSFGIDLLGHIAFVAILVGALTSAQRDNGKIVEMEKVHPIPAFNLRELSTMAAESALAGFLGSKIRTRSADDVHWRDTEREEPKNCDNADAGLLPQFKGLNRGLERISGMAFARLADRNVRLGGASPVVASPFCQRLSA